MKNAIEARHVPRLSDTAVQAKTGKPWQEWFAVLDAAGARAMDHQSIAAYLYQQLRLPGWWAQMVTVGYEQARGRRQKHQRPPGYEISRSKTFDVPLAKLFAAWQDKRRRDRWLKEARLVIRKATPNKSLRITWADGKTSVEALFYSKGKEKSQLTVQHSKLADAKHAERMKAYWVKRLDALKMYLES